MKKITFAVLALMASGSAFASGGNATYDASNGAATMTDAVNAATNYTYTVAATAADRLFVKNNFDFTLSANTIIETAEDADGRYMGVATSNVRGRNVFTGHSDGGSVTTCGDPLTATEAKEANKHATELAARFDETKVTNSACGV